MNATQVYFGDRKTGEKFFVHAGSDQWIYGEKIGVDTFRKENGYVIGVSRWTKTKN